MEKNLVKKLENFLKPRIKNILSFKDDDKRDNMLSSIIKRITGEEEGTKEFFKYYDYSLNKVLYPDAQLDALNEAVEITLEEPEEEFDLNEGKKLDKVSHALTGTSTKSGRRAEVGYRKKDAEKANKKLEKAKTKGKSEKKIAKLQAKKKKAGMRATAASINSAADKVKSKKTNESENPLLEKCLNESLNWKENYGEDNVILLNDLVTNDNSLYNEPTFDQVFDRINEYVSETLNIDSMSDECMGITHELIEEYGFDADSAESDILSELGDLSWVDEEYIDENDENQY